MAEQGRHVLIVEDEQDERYALPLSANEGETVGGS